MAKKKNKQKAETLHKDEELYNELYQMVEDAENNSSTWRDNTDVYYRLRIRHKKTKNFPFPGCSNLRLPTIETYLRKAKAALIGIYANVKPRMMVIPQSDTNLEKARRIEKFLDWLCDVKIGLLDKLVIAVDKMLERGFSLMKVVWRMEDREYTETISLNDLSMEEATQLFDINTTDEMIGQAIIRKYNVDLSETVAEDNLQEVEKAVQEIRAGKDTIKLKLRDELYNAPDVIVIDPIYAGVPTDSDRNPQKCRAFYHEYFEPWDDIVKKADAGILDKEAVDNINFVKDLNHKDFKLLINTKDAQEGIDRLNNPSKTIRVIDLYAYYDLDGEGVRRCHFLLAPDFRQILKKQSLENDSQKWPVVRLDAEVIDDRWYSSRGYPQHLEDLSKEIDAQHNQKIDNQTIRNAPMFLFRSGIINPRLIKFIPGQAIPVPGMTALKDAFEVVNNQNPNVEFSYEREELLLKTVIQEYLGQMDYSVQSIINKRQPRTLGEVQMQAQAANTVFGLDAALFTTALSELFTQLLELCQQYMPERVFTLVSGEQGIEPLHLSRDEIQGKYHIICRGNDMNSNPILRAQKSLAKVQLLLSPIPLQLGIVNPLNAYNAVKRYLQDDGELGWKELISMPQPKPQQQAAGVIRPNFDDLTDAEQAQVLSQLGVKPDMQGRALKSRSIVQEKQSEQASQQIDNLKNLSEIFEEPAESKK